MMHLATEVCTALLNLNTTLERHNLKPLHAIVLKTHEDKTTLLAALDATTAITITIGGQIKLNDTYVFSHYCQSEL
jgi:hypothetical protein